MSNITYDHESTTTKPTSPTVHLLVTTKGLLHSLLQLAIITALASNLKVTKPATQIKQRLLIKRSLKHNLKGTSNLVAILKVDTTLVRHSTSRSRKHLRSKLHNSRRLLNRAASLMALKTTFRSSRLVCLKLAVELDIKAPEKFV